MPDPIVGMSDPRPGPLTAAVASAQPALRPVQGFNPIQWIDQSVLEAANQQYTPTGGRGSGREYQQNWENWNNAGQPADASWLEPGQMQEFQARVARQNAENQLHSLLGSQGINTQFSGRSLPQHLTGEAAAARGLDPSGQYMLIHQTDPRDTGSGNRTQVQVLYQRDPSTGQAVPVWAGDGFEGKDPSSWNRSAAITLLGGMAGGALGGYYQAANAATQAGGAGAGAVGSQGATNAALIESQLGTAGYGASSAGAGGASMAAAPATNAALIESAVGTPGYGMSSAGAGGVNTAATNAALIESAMNTPGYGASSAGAGANSTGTIGGSSFMDTAREVYDNASRARQVADRVQQINGRGAATGAQGASSSGGGATAAGVAAALEDRTKFDQPDLDAIYGMSTKAAKRPASNVKADPTDPIDANGLQIAAIQELTQRVQKAKSRLAQLQGSKA